jgi:transcriptional regulator with XRE-family HTH domain
MTNNRIKFLRKARGMSSAALAQAVGCTAQQMGRLEMGKRPLSLEWMQRISQVLGVHPVALLAPDTQEMPGEDQDTYETLLIDCWRRLTGAERRQVADLILELARNTPSADAPSRKDKELAQTG